MLSSLLACSEGPAGQQPNGTAAIITYWSALSQNHHADSPVYTSITSIESHGNAEGVTTRSHDNMSIIN